MAAGRRDGEGPLGGLNGLFPLAQEGLIDCWAGSLRHQKVLLHCNLLWMTSPKADLSTDKEERFNHSRLVPQFFPRIPKGCGRRFRMEGCASKYALAQVRPARSARPPQDSEH